MTNKIILFFITTNLFANEVTCPLHNWEIDLKTGEALGNDSGCTGIFETKIEDGILYLNI